MRLLLVALPLFVAVSALHGQEADAADRVRLEFRWPAGRTASVEAFRSKAKTGAEADTSQFGARYRMTLGEAPDGYVIRYDGFSVEDGLLDPGGGVARRIGPRGEDDVAAVEEGADVGEAEPLDEEAELGHRDLLVAAEVDAY